MLYLPRPLSVLIGARARRDTRSTPPLGTRAAGTSLPTHVMRLSYALFVILGF